MHFSSMQMFQDILIESYCALECDALSLYLTFYLENGMR